MPTFAAAVCTVSIPFWRDVGRRKADQWKLETPAVEIDGSLVPQVDGHWRLHIGKENGTVAGVPISGELLNTNSAEEFRFLEREGLIENAIQKIISAGLAAESEIDYLAGAERTKKLEPGNNLSAAVVTRLNSFVLLSFMNLKELTCHYNVAMPFINISSLKFKIQEETKGVAEKGENALHHGGSFDSSLNSFADPLSSAAAAEASSSSLIVLQPIPFIPVHLISRIADLLATEAGVLALVSIQKSAIPRKEDKYSDDSSKNVPARFLFSSATELGEIKDEQIVDQIKNEEAPKTAEPEIVLAVPLLSFIALIRAESRHEIKCFLCFNSPLSSLFRNVITAFALWTRGLYRSLPLLLVESPSTAKFARLQILSYPTFISSSPEELWPAVQAQCNPATSSGWLARIGNNGRKSATFSVALRSHMDPEVAQAEAVELNLRLIRWRILPSLDYALFARKRVLVLGTGTLGCNIIRTLLAWGLRQFTLVDSGTVALSSPVRQSLFKHSDALWNFGAGRLKCLAARDAILEIRPDAEVAAIPMEIPMPGHPTCPADVEKVKRNVSLLELLVDRHDIVLLLTDTRESRWLPAALCAAQSLRRLKKPESKPMELPPCPCEADDPPRELPPESMKKRNEAELAAWKNLLQHRPGPVLCVTVALGFDSFVVVRHGTRDAPRQAPGNRLACYFCNDLSAPDDSTRNRSLDQQCTVTRPGVSAIAAGAAAELLAALAQHENWAAAEHLSADEGAGGPSCLGSCPHTLRGNVAEFRIVATKTEAFQHCICCADTVVESLVGRDAATFINRILENSSVLEKISGLHELKQMDLSAVEVWSDEEDEGKLQPSPERFF